MQRDDSADFAVGPPRVARSPQEMRGFNAAAILGLFWDSPAGTQFTASELVERTGLTRATVLAVCDGLRDAGWLTEDRAPTATPGRGRQARRFTFESARSFVVASDIGLNSVTTVVADLHGNVHGRARHRTFEDHEQIDRTEHLIQSIDEAIDAAAISRDDVITVCVGVAASVGPDGIPLHGNPFWDLFRIDEERFAAYAPWPLHLENDADLAAIAEERSFEIDTARAAVTLLISDRFGAGITVAGSLLRGAHGTAGEMAYLDYVRGVDNPFGVTLAARVLRDEALAAGRDTQLREAPADPEASIVETILDAADAGDTVSLEIIDHLVERLSLTISTIAHLLDPERFTLAGGAARSVAPLLSRVQDRLGELLPYVPNLHISTLGRDVVLVGAVQSAIQRIRRDAI